MKFGRINLSELEKVDFSLPKSTYFLDKKSESKFQLLFAAPAWGIPAWKGSIYPKRAKQTDFLKEYAKKFPAIEFNSSFYRIPTVDQISSWKSEVGKDFKFCLKVPKVISHAITKKINTEYMHMFYKSLQELGTNRGITFLQLQETISPEQWPKILSFLNIWNKEFDLAVEFRHPSWFEDSVYFEELSKLGICSVITDSAGKREAVHMNITSSSVVMRWVGNELHKSDYERIDSWIDRIKEYKNSGVKNVYFFIHEPGEVTVPEITDYFVKQVNRELGLGLEFDLVQDENLSLF